MLINPGRETFINFPSSILPDKTVTVFLPEPAVPLRGKYPVVYLIGAIPKDAAAVQEFFARTDKKAILVGVNTTEEDLKNPAAVMAFFSRELIPYIDTNYPTFAEPAFRAVAARGEQGIRLLAALLTKKELFTRAFLLHSGTMPISFAGADENLRLLAAGTHEELAVLWQTLQESGRAYGTQVALRISEKIGLTEELDLDYLFAPQADVRPVKLEGSLQEKTLSIAAEQPVSFSVSVILENGMKFDYIPLSLRISPPYLDWNPLKGVLRPIPGAAAGKVKIGVIVDKLNFTAKIRLKK